MGRRIVPEFGHTGTSFECGLHNGPLHSTAPPMNEANLAKAGGGSGLDILVYDLWDVAWRKCVEIDLGFDWNAEGAHCLGGWEAVTTVLIPPRTEKSPTTVIRLG